MLSVVAGVPSLFYFLIVTVTLATSVSQLLCGPQPHACLATVANLLDEEDPMEDDWRRLWNELIRRTLDVNVVKRQAESPTIFTLKRWCRMAPPESPTIGKLIAALSAIYRNDVAAKLTNYVKVTTCAIEC